jgi:hypothetical protein
MAFLEFNITVAAGGVTLTDLGNRTFSAGTYDLGAEFQIDEIRYSLSLAQAIDDEDITLAVDSVGRQITKQSTLADTITLLNKAGHIYDTDDLLEGSTNLYYTDTRARQAISIETGSTQFLGYNNSTGELSISALAITDVTVDSFAESINDWVATTGNYTGTELQEGDVLILANATDGVETWIHNGGTAGTASDFTLIQQPQLTDSYILALLSGGDAINYNNTTGEISVLFDNDTIKLNTANEIYVDESALTIIASQISDFGTEVNNEIFETGNFIDGTTIDFTVTSGTSITAEVVTGSLTEDYLAINTPSTGADGDLLTSDGNGNFEWTDPSTFSKKSWTWGAASGASSNTDRFLDRHDGAPTNLTPYVAWYDCELKAISLTQEGTVTWTAEVYINGVLSLATLSSGGNATAFTVLGSPISIQAGDRISFRLNGTDVSRPAIDAFFETV